MTYVHNEIDGRYTVREHGSGSVLRSFTELRHAVAYSGAWTAMEEAWADDPVGLLDAHAALVAEWEWIR